MKKYILPALMAMGCMTQKPTARIDFEAPGAYPEGIAWSAADNVFYVSSARLGTIGKVTPSGGYSVLLEEPGLKSTYGMKMHPDGKRLFVCAGDANYSKYTSPGTRKKMARLISIDCVTGKKLADTDLAALLPGKHFPNDLVFDDKGNAYITDSYAHAIYKVTGAGEASVFSKHKLFETEGVGLNGIVYHPNGFLLAASTNKGCIYKIPMNDPGNVQQVAIDQFFVGADGLLLNNSGRLTVVVNGGSGKIYRIESDDDWKSAKLTGATLLKDRFNYPSTATQKGDETWIMNAKFNELVDSNAVPSKRFFIQQAVLKPVPHNEKNKEEMP